MYVSVDDKTIISVKVLQNFSWTTDIVDWSIYVSKQPLRNIWMCESLQLVKFFKYICTRYDAKLN